MTRTSKQHIVQNKIECLEFGGSLGVGSQDAQMSWQTKAGSAISMYYFDNNAPKKTHDNQLNKSAFDSWTNKKTLIYRHRHDEPIGYRTSKTSQRTNWFR